MSSHCRLDSVRWSYDAETRHTPLWVVQRRPQAGADRRQRDVEQSAESAMTAMDCMAAVGRGPLSGQGRPEAGRRSGSHKADSRIALANSS